MKRCGMSITTRHVRSVSPSVEIAARQYFFNPRARSRFSFARCSCIISTVSAIANGLTLIVGYGRINAPVVYSVNTNGGVSPAHFRIASVCGASIYPLTGIVHARYHGHEVGRLGIICSGRPTVAPVRSSTVDYGCRYVYPPNARHGYARHHSIPNSGTFMPSITNLVVNNRIMGSLINFMPVGKWGELRAPTI